MKKYEIRFCGTFDMIAKSQDIARSKALKILDAKLLFLGRSTDEYTIVGITEVSS